MLERGVIQSPNGGLFGINQGMMYRIFIKYHQMTPFKVAIEKTQLLPVFGVLTSVQTMATAKEYVLGSSNEDVG